MKKPLVFMYSGQGAQYYQMGKELYDQDAGFRGWMDRCSEIVEPIIGVSLAGLLYRGNHKKFDPFDRTLYTHPANVALGYSLTQTLYDRGLRPDWLLGYSLGEYTAAIVSGALGLEDGLKKIVGQAQLLEAKTSEAGMMAILEDPSIMRREAELFANCWLSGHNFPQHFVITGYQRDLNRIEEALRPRQVTCQILPISHGFHSPLVDPIRQDCLALFDGFAGPRIPFISALTTGELSQFNAEHIWSVIRNPVRFLETVKRMEARSSYVYVDVGPAGTLSTFVKYGLGRGSSSQAHPTINQFGKDLASLQKLLSNLD